ncbi:hypothetical protein AVEN_70576-1 [Araneus ventricosus]|uniref:Uncharacterized protein n=1 Tax=Araneus ventricosus TaxID=182803 RepID=A0A4Y2QLT2_ARAVE|nr:hypothetical protein AVEN_70576-1 [Araneus ventricosus]
MPVVLNKTQWILSRWGRARRSFSRRAWGPIPRQFPLAKPFGWAVQRRYQKKKLKHHQRLPYADLSLAGIISDVSLLVVSGAKLETMISLSSARPGAYYWATTDNALFAQDIQYCYKVLQVISNWWLLHHISTGALGPVRFGEHQEKHGGSPVESGFGSGASAVKPGGTLCPPLD